MKRTRSVELLLNALVTIPVLILAILAIRRELFPTAAVRPSRGTSQATTPVSEWTQVLAAGLPLAAPQGVVQVAVFEDMECPYCKTFHENVLRPTIERYAGSVNAIFVHLPLPMHRFAFQAAQAVECASGHGKVNEFVDLAYSKQDSIGLISWEALASRVGIVDTLQFGQCAKSDQLHPRISDGVKLADKLGVSSTPTIMVNGQRFTSPPSAARLSALVDSLLAAPKVDVQKGFPQ